MKKQKKESLDQEYMDPATGELIREPKLNQIITKTSIRLNGTLRVQHFYDYCPTLAEQHTAHLTDINYLIARYKPDELAAYIAARSVRRPEILGHDFSLEHDLQSAKNVVYAAKQIFDGLDDEHKIQFRNTLEFVKFIDNPQNAEKMVKMGLITPQQRDTVVPPPPTRTTTQEEATAKG